MSSVYCFGCGQASYPLAQVSDPFTDQSYCLCVDCLAPIYDKFRERMLVRAVTDRVTEEAKTDA